jgi:hypothetical protein
MDCLENGEKYADRNIMMVWEHSRTLLEGGYSDDMSMNYTKGFSIRASAQQKNASKKTTVFWVVEPCRLVEVYQYFT